MVVGVVWWCGGMGCKWENMCVEGGVGRKIRRDIIGICVDGMYIVFVD